MKLLILVYNKDSMLRNIKDYLTDDYTLLECEMGPRSLQLLNSDISGVVLVDLTDGSAAKWLQETYFHRPDLTYLGLLAGEDEPEESLAPYFYDYIRAPFSRRAMAMHLERAWERVTLRLKIKAQELEKPAGAAGREHAPPPGAAPVPRPVPHKEHVLREFSKALGNNFNRGRLLELFLDTVAELVPAGKLSVLSYDADQEVYKIILQRGLDPRYAAGLFFKPASSLISQLAAEGCILRAGETPGTPANVCGGEVLQEMKLLQAAVCIPLPAHGQLAGVLNIGPKITGLPFYEEELEVLFTLCGNVALALRDIDLYHKVCDQKAYIESVLQRMNSGVVAINKQERIITFNPRAGELLQLSPQEMLGRDLRALPSPMGDLLYETSAAGHTRQKEEIVPAAGKVPLEVTTYQLLNREGESLGSVMIFDDVTPRKQLEVERRQADQLDVLNKFVGQLAHEIKNPMVAIQTFAELLTEKYDDSAFREFFTATVRQEVRRLNELVERLIAFSAPLSYKYSTVDIHEILDLGLSLLQEQGMGQETTVETTYAAKTLPIKADKHLLARAFSYLLRDCFQSVETGGALHIRTVYADGAAGGVARISFSDNKTRAATKNVEKLFEPLAAHQNGYISLGLPVSRKIIEDHGGSLRAAPARDKSLEVEINLPIFPEGGG